MERVMVLTMQPDRFAPSRARSAIEGFTAEHEIGAPSAATLKLLVSELVTNAAIHSDAPAGEITLSAHLLEDHPAVRVEVTDEGSGFKAPSLPAPGYSARGGFGLHLLDSEATRWGVHMNGVTCVWFEVGAGSG
jgi:anti-sigma regulatory factor (Ser/Thr protein kinase)